MLTESALQQHYFGARAVLALWSALVLARLGAHALVSASGFTGMGGSARVFHHVRSRVGGITALACKRLGCS